MSGPSVTAASILTPSDGSPDQHTTEADDGITDVRDSQKTDELVSHPLEASSDIAIATNSVPYIYLQHHLI